MSTMYDALKRAESARRPEARAAGGSRDAGGPWIRGAVIVLGIIFLGLVGWNIFRAQIATEDRKAALARAEAARRTAAASPVPEAKAVDMARPAAVRYPPGTYTLEGIVNAGAGSMAVINGKILKLNETVEDMIVRSISAREVELSDAGGGRQVILKLQP